MKIKEESEERKWGEIPDFKIYDFFRAKKFKVNLFVYCCCSSCVKKKIKNKKEKKRKEKSH